jgi:hypothetical protein
MKKSRRQKQRRRRQSRKPRISRGGAFGHYLGHAIEAATICEHTIHLVKNVNKSIETLTFCQRIITTDVRDVKLIERFTARLSELTKILKLISKNRVITAVVSFTVRFFDGDQSSELKKLTDAIPNAQEITDRSLVFDMLNASAIFAWGEWYNTKVSEATNNLIAVVTEIIALQIGLPMKPAEEIVPPPAQITQAITPPANPYNVTPPSPIAGPHVTPLTNAATKVVKPTPTGASFTLSGYDD